MDRTPTSIPVRTLPARIALYANVLIIAVSLVSIIGWICKTPALASWGHAYKPIAISVAMYFLLLSALFLAKTIRPKSALLGASLMIVALAAIGQNVILILSKGYLFTAIDLITQGKSISYLTENASKASPLASIGFIIAGFSIIISALSRKKTAAAAADVLALFVFFWGFTGMVGYLYGTPLLYGGGLIPISLPATIMFMLLAIALVAHNSPESPVLRMFLGPSTKSRLVRAFLPAIAMLLLVTGWVDNMALGLFTNVNIAVLDSISAIIILLASSAIIAVIARWTGQSLEATQKNLHSITSRQEALLSAIPEIIMEVDANKVYTWANKSGYDFFGDDVIGKEAALYFEGEQTTYQTVQPLFNGDENVIYVESWQRRRDGQKRLLAWWCRVLKDTSGGATGALSSARDMTEIRQAEEAIAAEKERLAVTLRSIGDGVITTDIHGNIVTMNKVAEKLTGWPQSEAHNRPLAEVFSIINEITRKPCENPVELVLSSGEVVELANHTLLVSRDGKGRLISDSGAPIKDRNSVTIGVVLVFRDMTEKQLLQDAMQRSEKLDSLGVLAGGIAHDFNNLLAGIFGYIDMARHASQADTPAAKYLDKASLVFNRAKDLTQRLLTFSKGGAPVLKTGQLGPLVKESAAFALSGSKISCEYHIANDLWPCDFDENQIAQVVDNIVINAQQAMPMGGTIMLSANNVVLKNEDAPGLRGGNFVKVSVADTGVGIPRGLLKRIFDPFFTTKQKGSGLGLATCYSIVEKHQGRIEVESEPGKGSVFHVLLPASHKETASGDSRSAQTHKGNGAILVMDDEEFMREIIGTMLKEMGYAVLEARNGEEALRLCVDAHKKGTAISAAVLDLTIPGGMGGKETIVEMRKICPDMPVFASSGFSEDPVMSNPADYGFTASIRKPYRKDELAEVLNRNMKTSSPSLLLGKEKGAEGELR